MKLFRALFLAIGALAACLAAGGAGAATVQPSLIVAEAQMMVSKGKLDGCGFRLKAIPKDAVNRATANLADVSFMFYPDSGAGLIKGGVVNVKVGDTRPGSVFAPQLTSFWVKAPKADPTYPPDGKYLQSESKGYLLYAISMPQFVNLYRSVMEGLNVAIGVRVKGEAVDQIFSGEVSVSDADREQAITCNSDLLHRLERSLQNEQRESGR
ncbi:MAG: hypothetical protein RI906_938 [Pseudomonadota bacterium]|jgi:hypothetical protein